MTSPHLLRRALGSPAARLAGRGARATLHAALDLLFPRRCLACDADLAGEAPLDLCPRCRGALVPVLDACPRCAAPRGALRGGRRCPDCRRRRPAFRGAVAAVEYRDPVDRMVQRLKYGGQRFQAFALGEMLGRILEDAPWASAVEAIVPVPLDRRRKRERGYNQAALLAAEVARRLRRPVRERWLARIRPTLPQTGLSRAARQRNLTGCFRARGRRVRGRTLLLVDDVLTTGTTLSEAARALRRAGAAAVYAAAVARA